MYTKEQLVKFPFFAKVLEEEDVRRITDSLTGLLLRSYIIDYVKYLISENIPFSLFLLDLDNFKFINDSYGHTSGDNVLSEVAKTLISFLGDNGVAGRFGGDEYLFVHLHATQYDDIKTFLHSIYNGKTVLRRNYDEKISNSYVTATIGCAVYPLNAQDYNSLFSLIDKTLYRGKSKGRNCYIIYLESKHKDIEIKQLGSTSLYPMCFNLVKRFDSERNGFFNKLGNIFDSLCVDFRITDLYYMLEDNVLRSLNKPDLAAEFTDIFPLLDKDTYQCTKLEELRLTAPVSYEALMALDIETMLIVRICTADTRSFCLLCAEPHTHRIWQEKEVTLLLISARLLSAQINIPDDGEKL